MILVGVFMLSPRANLYPKTLLVSSLKALLCRLNSTRVLQWSVFPIMPSSLWGLVHFQNTYHSLWTAGMLSWVWRLLCTLNVSWSIHRILRCQSSISAWKGDRLVGLDTYVLSDQWIYPYFGLVVLLRRDKVVLCIWWKMSSMTPYYGCAVQRSQESGTRRMRRVKDCR